MIQSKTLVPHIPSSPKIRSTTTCKQVEISSRISQQVLQAFRQDMQCFAQSQTLHAKQAAVYGRDPNWGRIACAAGYAGISFDQTKLRVLLGDIVLMDGGEPQSFNRVAASDCLRKAGEIHGTVVINVAIGDGPGRGQAWGCDLSYDYVKINAEYTQ